MWLGLAAVAVTARAAVALVAQTRYRTARAAVAPAAQDKVQGAGTMLLQLVKQW